MKKNRSPVTEETATDSTIGKSLEGDQKHQKMKRICKCRSPVAGCRQPLGCLLNMFTCVSHTAKAQIEFYQRRERNFIALPIDTCVEAQVSVPDWDVESVVHFLRRKWLGISIGTLASQRTGIIESLERIKKENKSRRISNSIWKVPAVSQHVGDRETERQNCIWCRTIKDTSSSIRRRRDGIFQHFEMMKLCQKVTTLRQET